MKALVTGGAGFVGSMLVDRLLAEGHAVDVVDDLSSGSLANLANARSDTEAEFRFQRLDVSSMNAVEVIARRRPEVVYHLAGGGTAASSVADPVGNAEANVIGSLRVLEGARLAGARKVIFATAGSAVYGELAATSLPARETLLAGGHGGRSPISPHGVAKISVGAYLAAYRELHDLEYSALALATVYGPRQQPGKAGGVVANFVDAAMDDRPATIYGDGSQTRDFVYVDDVVDALARAADRGSGLTLNVGTGVETTIRALHDAVGAHTRTALAPEWAPQRPGEVARSCLDSNRAAIHLGWLPWTTLDAGLTATVEWFSATG